VAVEYPAFAHQATVATVRDQRGHWDNLEQ
jgi:hypothetical protein